MKKKIKLIILALAICLNFPIFSFAEIIVLKSGKTVEGKLIEKTDKYIKIDFQEVPLTYFFDEIETIDGKKISLSLLRESAVDRDTSNSDNDAWYINNDFSIKIRKIPNWTFRVLEDTKAEFPFSTFSFGFLIQRKNSTIEDGLFISVRRQKGQVKKDEEFLLFADTALDAAAKAKIMSNISSFTKNTISINNVKVREGRFEYKEKNRSFILRQLFFYPVETSTDTIIVVAVLVCESNEYLAFQSDIERSLSSIEIGK